LQGAGSIGQRYAPFDRAFANSASDAFDGDFVEGEIDHCSFHDIVGDAIDVSGSQVSVQNTMLINIRDKGISAGEKSNVQATGIVATDTAIGIASKDRSYVTAIDVTIERAWIAGFAAYMKKAEYGPAAITASKVSFKDESTRALLQEGSQITIDGLEAKTDEVEIDELYARLEFLAGLKRTNWQFGEKIVLIGYDMEPASHPGEEFTINLFWRASEKIDDNYTVFLHLVDSNGQLIAQNDSMPAVETGNWTIGPVIKDPHVLLLEPPLPAGEYRIVLGQYDWQTGERLPITDLAGNRVENAAITLDQSITITN